MNDASYEGRVKYESAVHVCYGPYEHIIIANPLISGVIKTDTNIFDRRVGRRRTRRDETFGGETIR